MAQETPLISVIIPVYRVEQYLDRCLTSVREQTYRHLEILLIDDGSDDRSGEMCDEYARQDERIRVFHKTNGGIADTRNYGYQVSQGEYILYIDSDDYVDTDMIETLYQLMIEHNADMATCGVYNCYVDKIVPQCETLETGCVDGETAFGYVLEGKKIPGTLCNKLIPSAAIADIRFPIGRLYEDAFFTADLMPLFHRVAYTTAPKYYYFHRAGSITTSRFKTRDMDVIAAYDKTKKIVDEQFPALSRLAQFRYDWAHFVVLDRMLAREDYKTIPELPEVVRYLKQHAFSIARNGCFTKARRIAALVLRCSLSLYQKLMLRYQNQVAQEKQEKKDA